MLDEPIIIALGASLIASILFVVILIILSASKGMDDEGTDSDSERKKYTPD